jgi:hypothetical protein
MVSFIFACVNFRELAETVMFLDIRIRSLDTCKIFLLLFMSFIDH